jgi:phosphoglucomutase
LPASDLKNIKTALSEMIFSPSGWRGVFAVDGNAESSAADISCAHRAIASCAASVFADYIRQKTGAAHPAVIVGMDTRPTGPAIACAIAQRLTAEGCSVLWTDIAAAPEIMAYARSIKKTGMNNAEGFIYISASHNPLGHNGLKFGLLDGGVLNAGEMLPLIGKFKERIDNEAYDENAGTGFKPVEVKPQSLAAYRTFARDLISGDGIDSNSMLDALRKAVKEKPVGVVCDFNGSARAASIDRDFFLMFGIDFASINDKPGEIAHRIVPEGESLIPCRRFLEEQHEKNGAFIFGYTPDCDGDRGNLVIWDETIKEARPLEAQEVFALACISELAHLRWTDSADARKKIAVAVNDATSMRVDRIAAAFGASVFRAEVGEANVVSLARSLREKGWTVRILGEGAAGGNITHPSAVRDPLSTVMAIIKLLAIRSDDRLGFFDLWLEASGRRSEISGEITLSKIIASLPPFITTGAYTDNAVMQVKTNDHAALKRSYQKIFSAQWKEMRGLFSPRGIDCWKAFCYNGIAESACDDDFGRSGKGGLKINLYDAGENAVAALWMRGSATEPVFRVMADVEGRDADFEIELVAWQRRMVAEADKMAM